MEWVAAIAFIFSMAAWAVAFFLWRRLRRLKRQEVRKSPTPAHLERGLFDSVELSLAAMLEELELKEREILQRIERRERELFDSIARVVGHAKSEPIPVSEPAGDEVGQPAHSVAVSDEAEEPAQSVAVSAEAEQPVRLVAVSGETEEPVKSVAVSDDPPDEQASDVLSGDAKSAAVLRLAAQGLDVVAIAKQLGIGKGEVALILKLGQSP